MAHIKLQNAYLCMDCETVGNDPSVCVVCLSTAVYPLAKFLNRESHTCADMSTEILPCHACAAVL